MPRHAGRSFCSSGAVHAGISVDNHRLVALTMHFRQPHAGRYPEADPLHEMLMRYGSAAPPTTVSTPAGPRMLTDTSHER